MAGLNSDGLIAWTTTAGNKTIAPGGNIGGLIIVIAANSGRTAAQAPTITDDNGGTYTLAGSATKATNVDSMWAFVRNTNVTTNGTVNITMTQSSDTGGGLTSFSTVDLRRAGLAAIRQINSQDNAVAGTPTVVMSKPFLAANAGIGVVFTGTNGSANSAAPVSGGWAEVFDQGYNTPPSGIELILQNNAETASTITWSAVTPSAFCAMVLEIDLSQLPNPNKQLVSLLAH